MNKTEQTITSETLKKGKYFSFKSDTVKLPSGATKTRDIVDHPGAVAIIPVHDETIMLVRQYRYPAKQELLEIPAGTLEPGEDPMQCAVRELREETGYAASNWTPLLYTFMSPGYSSEVIHFFVAEKLTHIGAAPDEDELIDVEQVDFNTCVKMIEDHEIIDAKTVTGILSYLTRAL